jgi:hypothetical protein
MRPVLFFSARGGGEIGGIRRTPNAPRGRTRNRNSRSVWSAAYPAAFVKGFGSRISAFGLRVFAS